MEGIGDARLNSPRSDGQDGSIGRVGVNWETWMRFKSALAIGLLVAGSALAQTQSQAPRVSHERDLTGMRWVGRTDVEIPGFENLGGGFVEGRAEVAITSFRHRQNRRDWIVTSQRRVGMDGDMPVWLGASSVRLTIRSTSAGMATACKPARQGLGNGGFVAGMIGLVADNDHAVKRRDYGLLRAQRAWRITPEGAFTPVDEPVVCNDEGYGI
jgi:hypothetical protein